MNFFVRHLQEVRSTIKLEDIEEKYDIYFSRFFGLFFAKWADRLTLHPDHVSILSLVSGLVGAVFLYFQSEFHYAIIAAILIVLSGILDSADGQLARLSKKSSEFGRALDGTIDTLVFTSLYVAGILFVLKEFSWVFLVLGVLSLYAHGVKTSIYEFYKSEYLRFVGFSKTGHTPFQLAEIQLMGRKIYHYCIHLVLLMLTSTQLQYIMRSRVMREKMVELFEANQNRFSGEYQKENRKMMPLWAWTCGLNIHRNGIVIFSLFGRFDWYIYANLVWTITVIPVSYLQLKKDKLLLKNN